MILRQVTVILLLALVSLFLVSARVVQLNDELKDTLQNGAAQQFFQANQEQQKFVDEEIEEEEAEAEEDLQEEEEEEEEVEEKDVWIELEDPSPEEEEDFDASKLEPVSFSNTDLSELSEEQVYKGLPADIGMFPYVVYVQINKLFFCTGILYDKNTVLTAAHCVDPKFYNLRKPAPQSIIVRAGSTNRIRGGQTSVVARFKTHPDFDPKTFANDIAVLSLKTPFQLNAKKYYAQAAKFSSAKLKPKANYWLAGYGLTTSQDSQEGYPISLQYGQLQWQKDQVCERAFTSTARKINPKSEFCAGGGDGDMMSGCRGDSGGPLVTAKSEKDVKNGKAKVVGMLFYGVNCGGPNIFLSLKNNNNVWNFIRQNA